MSLQKHRGAFLRSSKKEIYSLLLIISTLLKIFFVIYDFSPWLESQDALPKSSERSYTVPNLILAIQIFAFTKRK